MDLLTFLIYILATWRLASMLAHEPGPWLLFERLRHGAGVRFDESSRPYGTTEVSKAMLCIWCSSVWIGAGWAGLVLLWADGALWLALPFALSAGAILVEEVTA